MDISWWGGGDGHQIARADYDVVMLPEGAAILWRISLILLALVAHSAGAGCSSRWCCWLIPLVLVTHPTGKHRSSRWCWWPIPLVLLAHPAGAGCSSRWRCWLILLVRIIGIMLIFRWGVNPSSDTPCGCISPASPASSRHRLVAFPAYSFTTTSSTPCPAVNLSRRCASSYVHPSMNRPPTYISLGFLSR